MSLGGDQARHFRDCALAGTGSRGSFDGNFRIIGQGTGNNFLVHQVFHVTVNANGEVTAFVDHVSGPLLLFSQTKRAMIPVGNQMER